MPTRSSRLRIRFIPTLRLMRRRRRQKLAGRSNSSKSWRRMSRKSRTAHTAPRMTGQFRNRVTHRLLPHGIPTVRLLRRCLRPPVSRLKRRPALPRLPLVPHRFRTKVLRTTVQARPLRRRFPMRYRRTFLRAYLSQRRRFLTRQRHTRQVPALYQSGERPARTGSP